MDMEKKIEEKRRRTLNGYKALLEHRLEVYGRHRDILQMMSDEIQADAAKGGPRRPFAEIVKAVMDRRGTDDVHISLVNDMTARGGSVFMDIIERSHEYQSNGTTLTDPRNQNTAVWVELDPDGGGAAEAGDYLAIAVAAKEHQMSQLEDAVGRMDETFQKALEIQSQIGRCREEFPALMADIDFEDVEGWAFEQTVSSYGKEQKK